MKKQANAWWPWQKTEGGDEETAQPQWCPWKLTVIALQPNPIACGSDLPPAPQNPSSLHSPWESTPPQMEPRMVSSHKTTTVCNVEHYM